MLTGFVTKATEIVITYPLVSLVVISAALTLFTTMLMMHFTDQEHLKHLKKRQKELQKDLKKCQKDGDHCKLKEVNDEMMTLSMKLMKASFSLKQMIITIVPFMIIIGWLRGIYTELYGGIWILYYIVVSIIASTTYRKIFKMA